MIMTSKFYSRKSTLRLSLWTVGFIFSMCLCIGNAGAQSLSVNAVSLNGDGTTSAIGESVSGDMPWVSEAIVITRADFLAMDSDTQNEVLLNIKNYQITDLVNATSANTDPQLDEYTYISVMDFYSSGNETKSNALLHPEAYIVTQ
jgi:hypothetical protein